MNRVTSLLNIQYPIIQAGMVWCSGHKLASAASAAGALGVIGAGSMYPDVLREHIRKTQHSTTYPFAVNLPLLYPYVQEHIKSIIELHVPIVITSAGSPKTWTSILHEEGIKVIHVVSSVQFALKAEDAGVDAIVAEGFEAGGHNGREETTTMCLIPAVADAVRIPVISAGGIADGRSMAAAFALGAEAVQVGSRFAASVESSAHVAFKNEIIQAKEGDTELIMKNITPVRLLKNPFWKEITLAVEQGKSIDEIKNILGKGRARMGIFEGDLVNGELEIGQVASRISDIQPAKKIVDEMMSEFKKVTEFLRILSSEL
jgi:enoyl-[acyl-carrier protein] reductase II